MKLAKREVFLDDIEGEGQSCDDGGWSTELTKQVENMDLWLGSAWLGLGCSWNVVDGCSGLPMVGFSFIVMISTEDRCIFEQQPAFPTATHDCT